MNISSKYLTELQYQILNTIIVLFSENLRHSFYLNFISLLLTATQI